MTEMTILLGSYLAASFVLAALWVRVRPRGFASKVIRKRLYFFPAVPLLALVDCAQAAGGLLAGVGRRVSRTFQILSGHRQYRRYNPYRYRQHSPLRIVR